MPEPAARVDDLMAALEASLAAATKQATDEEGRRGQEAAPRRRARSPLPSAAIVGSAALKPILAIEQDPTLPGLGLLGRVVRVARAADRLGARLGGRSARPARRRLRGHRAARRLDAGLGRGVAVAAPGPLSALRAGARILRQAEDVGALARRRAARAMRQEPVAGRLRRRLDGDPARVAAARRGVRLGAERARRAPGRRGRCRARARPRRPPRATARARGRGRQPRLVRTTASSLRAARSRRSRLGAAAPPRSTFPRVGRDERAGRGRARRARAARGRRRVGSCSIEPLSAFSRRSLEAVAPAVVSCADPARASRSAGATTPAVLHRAEEPKPIRSDECECDCDSHVKLPV